MRRVFLVLTAQCTPVEGGDCVLSDKGVRQARILGRMAEEKWPEMAGITQVVTGLSSAHAQMTEYVANANIPPGLSVSVATTSPDVEPADNECDDGGLRTKGGLAFASYAVIDAKDMNELLRRLEGDEAVIFCDPEQAIGLDVLGQAVPASIVELVIDDDGTTTVADTIAAMDEDGD